MATIGMMITMRGNGNNYDEGLRFNPKLNIPTFDGRMDADEFSD